MQMNQPPPALGAGTFDGAAQMGAIGAVGLVAGTFLPWVSPDVVPGIDGFEKGLPWVLTGGTETSAGSFAHGFVFLAVAAVAALLVWRRVTGLPVPPPALITTGGAGGALAVVDFINFQSEASDAGLSVGLGCYVTLGACAALVAAGAQALRSAPVMAGGFGGRPQHQQAPQHQQPGAFGQPQHQQPQHQQPGAFGQPQHQQAPPGQFGQPQHQQPQHQQAPQHQQPGHQQAPQQQQPQHQQQPHHQQAPPSQSSVPGPGQAPPPEESGTQWWN